ncbi:MAG: NAD(P)/FAD-dependent oxidoreductase [Spirochaetales bacterium]|nr:NAD(P)/FAD-dependent oxidoreductase [Spirochaetales bacterium]
MNKQYDLVVIGTGSAALGAAYKCRSAGWSVAVADYRPFGGTCALRGCDPKKVLLGAAEIVARRSDMEGKGVVGDLRIDWPALMRFKRTFTEPMPEELATGFVKAGVEPLHGRARFAGPRTLEVGGDILEARHILLATGAQPAPLPIPGAELLTTSEQFLDLEELPRRIVFVGGGYISFEFAGVAARAGAQVTILHRGARPLEGFDPELTARAVEAARQVGIEVLVNAPVEAVRRESGRLMAVARVDGRQRSFEAELLVHGAGRAPELDGLDLERGEVEREKRGVRVNEFLQSVSNPAVYAAGDAAASPGLPLTPVAGLEGGVAADNMLEGNRHRPDYRAVPTVVFTIPPMASVGLGEQEARRQGLEISVKKGDSSGWYTSRRIGLEHSGYKVILAKEDGRILGAHLLGPHAEEVINLFALAMRAGLKAGELGSMLCSYPTASYDMRYML